MCLNFTNSKTTHWSASFRSVRVVVMLMVVVMVRMIFFFFGSGLALGLYESPYIYIYICAETLHFIPYGRVWSTDMNTNFKPLCQLFETHQGKLEHMTGGCADTPHMGVS